MALPSTKRLEQLAGPEPSPKDLTFEHIDVDQLAAQTQVDRDCRYAQKTVRRRKRLFKWAMARIPDHEREAVKLSLQGKSQREIGEIQGVSQYTVCCRLKLAQNRLQWLCNVGAKVSAGKLRKATNGLIPKEDQRILLAWWETGSQSEAARRVYGTTYGKTDKGAGGRRGYSNCNKQYVCRESIMRSKNVIAQIPGLWRISQALESLWNNAYILIDCSVQNDTSKAITGLSPLLGNEAYCCVSGNVGRMTACAGNK